MKKLLPLALMILLSMTACSQKEVKVEPVLATVDSVMIYKNGVMEGQVSVNAEIMLTKTVISFYNKDNDSTIVIKLEKPLFTDPLPNGGRSITIKGILRETVVYVMIAFDNRKHLIFAGFGNSSFSIIFLVTQELENKNL